MTKTMLRLAAGMLAAVAMATPLAAAEKLRVGKAVPEAFSFTPIDVGIKNGIFAKHGIEVESIGFAGDAKMQQAAAADSIDILLGSGPAMAFIVKGSPIKGVAAMAGRPLLLSLIVRPDGTIKSVADLKGKRVSVSTVGSLTYWLVSELSRQQGWGPSGIVITPMGASKPQIAALTRGETDGMVTDLATAFTLENNGTGRILTRFGHIVNDFHIHIIFATDRLIAGRPAALRGFLQAWFETIAFMRHNKANTVEIARAVMNVDNTVAGRVYDELMPMFSDDGRFDAKALAVLRASYVELKLLDEAPDMSHLYTEAFLPGK